jgi:transposase InsO family protein
MIAQSKLSIKQACTTLSVSTSGYYDWKSKPAVTNLDEMALRSEIHSIALEFTKYGYRRITKELHRRKIVVNTKRIRRIMREDNLLVVRKKFHPITTQSNHKFPKHPNLAKDFTPTGVNQLWVADITYIRLQYEFIYLAVIIDLYSRRCIGWELSRDVTTQLTLNALNKAVTLRGIENVKGCVHHSDHGVQYASYAYTERLEELGMKPSMGDVGNSYDNAFAESFIKTLKYEEVLMNEYNTFNEAHQNIKRFIEEVYNKKRLHSSIGYVPPNEFEKPEVLNTNIEA